MRMCRETHLRHEYCLLLVAGQIEDPFTQYISHTKYRIIYIFHVFL